MLNARSLLNARWTNREITAELGLTAGDVGWRTAVPPLNFLRASYPGARMLDVVISNQHPPFPTSPLERVREGMAVIDERGRRRGAVVQMRMGYPQAVTAPADPTDVSPARAVVAPVGTGGTTAFGTATPVGLAPDLPDELRQELLRAGYIEVVGPSVSGLARYIHGDRIAEVTGDTIYLRIPPDISVDLPAE